MATQEFQLLDKGFQTLTRYQMQEKIKDLQGRNKNLVNFNHEMKDTIVEKEEEIGQIQKEANCFEQNYNEKV